MIHIIGPKDPTPNAEVINTTSRSTTWSKGLSPFFLGPVECYDGLTAKKVENAWQFSKCFAMHTDANGNPTKEYFDWRDQGWAKDRAERYPAGKGAVPLYSLWGKLKYTYVKARFAIYIPLYTKAVVKTEAFKKLELYHKSHKDIWLWDFDGYDRFAMGRDYRQVFEDPNKKAGHAFVLSALLDGVIDHEGKFVV